MFASANKFELTGDLYELKETKVKGASTKHWYCIYYFSRFCGVRYSTSA